MEKRFAGQVNGMETRSLMEKIENERRKLEDVSLNDLSRPEVIGRQQGFDEAVIQFMRERMALETEQKD